MADLTKTLDAVSKGLLYSLLASQCSVTSLKSLYFCSTDLVRWSGSCRGLCCPCPGLAT